jgi:hypothetical protein
VLHSVSRRPRTRRGEFLEPLHNQCVGERACYCCWWSSCRYAITEMGETEMARGRQRIVLFALSLVVAAHLPRRLDAAPPRQATDQASAQQGVPAPSAEAGTNRAGSVEVREGCLGQGKNHGSGE